MNRYLSLNSNLITFGIPLGIIASMVLLAQSSWFGQNPEALSLGITLDLALTVPLIYILLIRKKSIPKITAVPLFILGIIVASYILPSNHQQVLSLVKTWIFPVVELCVFLFIVSKVRAIYKNYQISKEATFDFYAAIKQAVHEILPDKINSFFAMEIATFYYGFFDWKSRELKHNEFSYHKKNSAIITLSFIIGLIVIETAVLHLLIQLWSGTVAWVLSIISVYTGLQLFGMTRSLNKRPIVITNDHLKFRYGILSESTIDIEAIETVELSTSDIETDDNIRSLSPLKDLDGGHNVVIHLKTTNTLYGLYGIKQTYRTLLVHVDDKQRFVDRVKEVMN